MLSVIHSQVYFPVLANTLKNVAGYLGFRWTDAGATGLHSITWREEWDRTHVPTLRDRLVRYNLDDCRALKTVADFITSFERRITGGAVQDRWRAPRSGKHERVATVDRAFASLRQDFLRISRASTSSTSAPTSTTNGRRSSSAPTRCCGGLGVARRPSDGRFRGPTPASSWYVRDA